MWNDQKSRRFDDLRRREAGGLLTEAESAELAGLLAELEAEAAQRLQPALDRMAQEANDLRAQTEMATAEAKELERIVALQETLLAEARAYAERLRQRRSALVDEFRRVRNGGAQAAR